MRSAGTAACAGLLALTLGAGGAAADMFKAYVGKYPSDPINGVSFNEHPVVKREIIAAGGNELYEAFQELEMETPMTSEEKTILVFKGRPRGFETTTTMVFSLDGELLALCFYDVTDPKASKRGEVWGAKPFKTNNKQYSEAQAQGCPSDFATFTRRAEASGLKPPTSDKSASRQSPPPAPGTGKNSSPLPPPPGQSTKNTLPPPPGTGTKTKPPQISTNNNLPPPPSVGSPNTLPPPPPAPSVNELPPPPAPPTASAIDRPIWVGGNSYCKRYGWVIGSKHVNLRSGPSRNYPIITALAERTNMVICNFDSSWYGVVVGNAAQCGLNLATAQTYQGPCLHGWMYQGFVAFGN